MTAPLAIARRIALAALVATAGGAVATAHSAGAAQPASAKWQHQAPDAKGGKDDAGNTDGKDDKGSAGKGAWDSFVGKYKALKTLGDVLGDANTLAKCIFEPSECGKDANPQIDRMQKNIQSLQRTVAENHAETTSRLNEIKGLQLEALQQNLAQKLVPLKVNGDAAARAYEALVSCVEARKGGAGACQGYLGGDDLQPARDVDEALADTRTYFIQQVRLMDRETDGDVKQVVAWFVGGNGPNAGAAGRDGLAFAQWRLLKNEQDEKPRAKATGNSADWRVPLVGYMLSWRAHQTAEYYVGLFARYGYLKVAAARLDPDVPSRVAASTDAEVKSAIAGKGRWTVRGTVAFYDLPRLRPGSVLMYDKERGQAAKAMIITPPSGRFFDGGRFAKPDDIRDLAVVANRYATVDDFATMEDRDVNAAPGREHDESLPPDGWYTVVQPYESRNWPDAANSGATFNVDQITAYNPKVHAAGPYELGNSTCRVRMRPMSARPSFPDGWAKAPWHADVSADYLESTWNKYAPGPIDYEWFEHRYRTGDGESGRAGWGAWLNCRRDGSVGRSSVIEHPIRDYPVVGAAG